MNIKCSCGKIFDCAAVPKSPLKIQVPTGYERVGATLMQTGVYNIAIAEP